MTMRIDFVAPGPGAWELETGHHGRRPLSAFIAEAYVGGFEDGFREMLEKYGLPLERVRAELVHGCTYVRPVGVGEGDKPSPTPPIPVMKVLARVHPGLRRRNRAAKRAWEQRLWRSEVDQWFERDRPAVVAANLAFQRIDVAALDDATLASHIAELLTHFRAQARANLAHHGGDMFPLGDYLAHCAEWGIAYADAAALLQGSSPATTITARLDKDEWLERHAWRVFTSDDIDRPTLAERPQLQSAAWSASAAPPETAPDRSSVRARVPAEQRDTFDGLLGEARYGLRQRDDVSGTRWNWSAGLLRRALLEAGRRCADRGRLFDAEHVVELHPDELESVLLTGAGPDATAAAARAAYRDEVEAAGPPDLLGDPEDPPPLAALPAPMRRATAALMTCLEADVAASTDDPLQGTGIGTQPYRGTARVVTSADDALDRLEPGDVLVARVTGPAYNSILPVLGALVTEFGGAICHAAIVAREFEIPAVIGASGATTLIADGALVEVDPEHGVVRILH